jgi:hypothetical protein
VSYRSNLSASRRRERPTCWGHAEAYDPYEGECQHCRYQHTCREEIESGGEEDVYHMPVNRPSRREDSTGVEVQPNRSKALVKPKERAIDRFLKDAAIGAVRGALWEMYQFAKRYRIP